LRVDRCWSSGVLILTAYFLNQIIAKEAQFEAIVTEGKKVESGNVDPTVAKFGCEKKRRPSTNHVGRRLDLLEPYLNYLHDTNTNTKVAFLTS
jgi:hypothetical protein